MTDKFRIESFDPMTGAASGVRENADGSSERITLHPPVEGQPLHDGARVVHTQRSGEPNTLHIETIYTHKGPAKVSSPKYREGYDAIFGGKQKVAEA